MKKVILLVLIVLIAAILRFYQLGTNPPAMSWDEVAYAYNAYSLGIDGRDEFGRFLPHDYLESFGDYKPPMYAYLDILPVKVFGLTSFATRFPSAFLGTLTVLLTYFLTETLFRGKKKEEEEKTLWGIPHSSVVGLLAAFFLAISPWHILLSRAGWEANVATFFLVLGIWMFLKAVSKNMWFLSLSAASFIASVYTFNTSRVFAPLIIIVMALLFWKTLWRHKKETVLAGVIGILLLLPTLHHLLSPQAQVRFDEVNIFTDPTIVQTSNQEIANDNNAVWSKVIHNRRVLYSLDFMQHYFDNLNFGFLFIQGDPNPKFSTQDVGQMYLWDFVFFIGGIFYLFKNKDGYWYILPLWLILGIIPAATARETPHALRIETTLPTFQILLAYGVYQFLQSDFLKKAKSWMRYGTLGGIAFLLLLNILYFLHILFVHYPVETSGTWMYGYQESIDYVKQVQNKYTAIDMTQELGRPYIYYLFYLKVDPRVYRKEANITRDVFGFVTVNSFGKYHFSVNRPSYNMLQSNVLYIDVPNQVPTGAHIVKTFYTLDNQVQLVAYTK